MNKAFLLLGALLLATSTAAQSPGPRVAGLFAYDSAKDRLVVYGGVLGRGGTGPDPQDVDPRTFAWNGTAWSIVAMQGPRSRDEMAYGFDQANGTLVMYGGGEGPGRDSRGVTNRTGHRETWHFRENRWTKVDTLGPEVRTGSQGAFDAARGRFVMFGGAMGSTGGRGPLAIETWEWDGKKWTRFDVPGPPGRTGHVMAYDAKAKHVILHGGIRSVDRVALTDTWAWNGAGWKLLTMEGPRTIFGAATAALDSGIVVFGGHRLREGNDSPRETWKWSGTSWSAITSSGPAPRTFHSMTTDVRNRRIYLMGGYGTAESGPLMDLWYLDSGNRWVHVQPNR